jgi:hypothetical protein
VLLPEKKLSAQPDGFGEGEEGQLVNRATAKAYIGLNNSDHDTFIDLVLASINRSVYEKAGRLLKRPAADWEYLLTGTGGTVLVLPQYPVPSVTTFEEGYYIDASTWQATRTVPAEDYHLDSLSGIIHGINRGWSQARFSYRVLFPGGPASVPEDIVEAICIWFGVRFQRRKTSRWDRIGEGFAQQSKSFIERDIPKDVRLAINRYHRPEVGLFA